MNKSILSLFNLSIRSINLASKFILIVFLAKLLSTEEFGQYGVLTAFINLSLYFIGLDFYTYSNREILKNNKNDSSKIIISHFYLIAIVYLISLPILFLLFTNEVLDKKYIVVFYIILILEHINQELMRFLITFGKPILSNLLFFIRSGAWSFIIISISYMEKRTDLLSVLEIWIAAEMICLVFSIITLQNTSFRFNFKKFDWAWIKKGLKICLPFMIGTLAIRAIFTGDRYIIEQFFNSETLASYILFSSLAAAIISFMDAAVFSFLYPKLVLDVNNRNTEYRNIIKQFYTKTIFFLIIINTLAFFLIHPLLEIIGKSEFLNHIKYFYFLIAIQSIYCLSMVPHYVLYSLHKDKHIIYSHLISAITFFILSLLFIKYKIDIYNILYALFISFFFLLLYKLLLSFKYIKIYEYTYLSKPGQKL